MANFFFVKNCLDVSRAAVSLMDYIRPAHCLENRHYYFYRLLSKSEKWKIIFVFAHVSVCFCLLYVIHMDFLEISREQSLVVLLNPLLKPIKSKLVATVYQP